LQKTVANGRDSLLQPPLQTLQPVATGHATATQIFIGVEVPVIGFVPAQLRTSSCWRPTDTCLQQGREGAMDCSRPVKKTHIRVASPSHPQPAAASGFFMPGIKPGAIKLIRKFGVFTCNRVISADTNTYRFTC
jgi:hypothetical protein